MNRSCLRLLARLIHARSGARNGRSFVAQIWNLLYRRLAVGRVSLGGGAPAGCKPAIQQSATLRHALLLASSGAICGLALLAGPAPRAAEPGARGQLLFFNLTNAPFPHPSRAGGFQYGGKQYPADVHYQDNRAAVFVPSGFQARTNVDLVVYFHGWREQIDRAIDKFRLTEQFAASGRNALLILPQGPLNAPDSSGGKLDDPGGFRRFIDEVLATLRARKLLPDTAAPGRIVLAGHSGGYQVISSILAGGGLVAQEVYLFDALYGRGDRFLDWLKDQPAARLVVIYNKDGGTLRPTQALITQLRTNHIAALVRQESGTTADQLRTNRISILFSDLAHAEVVHKNQNFRDYLNSSRLDPIPRPR